MARNVTTGNSEVRLQQKNETRNIAIHMKECNSKRMGFYVGQLLPEYVILCGRPWAIYYENRIGNVKLNMNRQSNVKTNTE